MIQKYLPTMAEAARRMPSQELATPHNLLLLAISGGAAIISAYEERLTLSLLVGGLAIAALGLALPNFAPVPYEISKTIGEIGIGVAVGSIVGATPLARWIFRLK